MFIFLFVSAGNLPGSLRAGAGGDAGRGAGGAQQLHGGGHQEQAGPVRARHRHRRHQRPHRPGEERPHLHHRGRQAHGPHLQPAGVQVLRRDQGPAQGKEVHTNIFATTNIFI